MSINEKIIEKAKSLQNETISIRNHLHEHPEVSGKEFETSKYLKSKVKELGLEIEEIPESTGFIAILDTKKEGKTLALRADIDALPVEELEENLSKKRSCISKNKGVMHACGHDAHMATLLSVMKILVDMKDELKGKIYFLFEEGEETHTGIDKTVKFLENKKIDAFYGNHVASFLKTGEISVGEGPVMAGMIVVDFNINGKTGHGSRPDLSINPVTAAANVITGLTNAWVNQLDVTKTVTFGITMINGGDVYNVFPATVNLQGSLRYYDVEEGEKALRVMKNVIDHTAAAHLCTVTYNEHHKIDLPPVVNDEELSKIAENGIEEILPGSVVKKVSWFASETMAKYRKIAPICFAFVGMKNEEYGSGAEHHNNKFDVDENVFYYSVASTAKFAVDYLTK